jgi:hypothetical protein
LGGLLGILAAWIILRRGDGTINNYESTPSPDALSFGQMAIRPFDVTATENSALTEPLNLHNVGHVESFTYTSTSQSLSGPTTPHDHTFGRICSQASLRESQSESQQRSNVYVVHHDGGHAPVTVYAEGADVVELPPSYNTHSNGIGPLRPQRQQANQTPRKPRILMASPASP